MLIIITHKQTRIKKEKKLLSIILIPSNKLKNF